MKKKTHNPKQTKVPSLSELLSLKSQLERVSAVITDLKALPNCYSCAKQYVCPHSLIDDEKPSRYNCFDYVRDTDKELTDITDF